MSSLSRILLVGAALAWAAVPAAADTILGLPDAPFAAYSPDVNTTDPGGANACSPGPCIIEQDSLPGAWGGLRHAPSSGVITSWKVKTADARTGLRVRVGVPGNLGSVSFVAASGLEAAPSAGTHSFASRVPIGAGQGVHLEWVGGGGSVLLAGGPLPSGAGVSIVNDTAAPAVGNTAFVTPATFISSPSTVLFMQATVEPDSDADGYGDTTQDCQPANAAAQACAPAPPGPAADSTGTAPVAQAAPASVSVGAPRLGTVRWSRRGRVITARTTASPGATYAMVARSGTALRRGACRVRSGVVTCTVRVRQGRWRVTVTPARGGVAGTPAGRSYRLPR